MGGRPLTALSIVAYPGKGDLDDLEEILKRRRREDARGRIASSWAATASPTTRSSSATPSPASSTRTASRPTPARRAGDVLVFTKRIGTGVISTALKRGIARDEDVEASIASMLTLNRAALRGDVAGRRARLHRRDRLRTDRPCPRDGAGQRRHAGDRHRARPVPARRTRLRAAGRDSRRPQEQPRIRSLRRGESRGPRGGDRDSALRSADLRRPADLPARGRRRLRSSAPATAPTASAACCRGRRSPSRSYEPHHHRPRCGIRRARRAVWSSRLGDSVSFYKVGMELYAAAGMEFVRELARRRASRSSST